MEPKISIIMPAYNVEKYISKSVQCIVDQTFLNHELLIIDDGSTDRTPKLCDALSEKYDKIQVYHKANGGVSDARNYGLERMSGDFLTFVDSDDLVTTDYLEYLYKLISQKENIDIAMTRGGQVSELDAPFNVTETASEIVEVSDAVKKMLKRQTYTHANWGKLYRASLWENVRFPAGVVYDDYDTTYRAFAKAKIVICGNAIKYSYLQRSGSLMHAKCSETTLSVLDVADTTTGFITNVWPENSIYAIDLQVATYMKNLQAILNTDTNAFPEEQDRIVRVVKKNARKLLGAKNIQKNDKIKILSLLIGKKLFLSLYNRFDGDLKIQEQ